ncbi:hypothetical protein ACHAQJ_005687 [Trichoderma viride]
MSKSPQADNHTRRNISPLSESSSEIKESSTVAAHSSDMTNDSRSRDHDSQSTSPQAAVNRERDAETESASQIDETTAYRVKEIVQSRFIPEMRSFFSQRIQMLLYCRYRTIAISDGQKKETAQLLPGLYDWETSSQESIDPFCFERFDGIITAINDALDKRPTRSKGTITRGQIWQDRYAEQIIRTLQNVETASNESLSSSNMTWLAALRLLFEQTYNNNDPEANTEQWRYYIQSALRDNSIEWTLGSSHGLVTAMIAQKVILKESLSLSPGSLKRAAPILDCDQENKRHKRNAVRINFECEFPLRDGLPAELNHGSSS